MAKLYAELTSDKGGRKASKSDNDVLFIELRRGNKHIATLEFLNDELFLYRTETMSDQMVIFTE